MHGEYAFSLPRGFVGPDGQVHRDGTMRLATARDEIEAQAGPAVRRNEAYLAVVLLARVVTRLGPVTDVTPQLLEGLYAADFDHLQRVYERLNAEGETLGSVACPHCGHAFELELSALHDGALAA